MHSRSMSFQLFNGNYFLGLDYLFLSFYFLFILFYISSMQREVILYFISPEWHYFY